MCNLYTVRKTAAEVAEYLPSAEPDPVERWARSLSGTPGTVIIENDGIREMRSMTWGFPLTAQGYEARRQAEAR